MNLVKYKVAGGGLIALAGIGFITVADDLRHTGELFGVLGILLAGITLLIAGFWPKASSMLALQWVAAGIGIGMVGGAALDRMVAGVCVGAALGLVMAYALRSRSSGQ